MASVSSASNERLSRRPVSRSAANHASVSRDLKMREII